MKILKLKASEFTEVNIIGHSSIKGNQTKLKKRYIFLKLDSLGYEGFAEYVAYRVISCSTLPKELVVEYFPADITFDDGHVEHGCTSVDFRPKHHNIVYAKGLIERHGFSTDYLRRNCSATERFDSLCLALNICTRLDTKEYISNILLIDAFICNEDRHLNNICFIQNIETGAYSFAPIFDNGGSFLSYTDDYPLYTPTLINLRNVKSKTIAKEFDKQLDGCNPTLRFRESELFELITELEQHKESDYIRRIIEVLRYSMKRYKDYLI